MKKAIDVTQEVPAIDQRILAAVERNGEYLGLTEWLSKYAREAEAGGDAPPTNQRSKIRDR